MTFVPVARWLGRVDSRADPAASRRERHSLPMNTQPASPVSPWSSAQKLTLLSRRGGVGGGRSSGRYLPVGWEGSSDRDPRRRAGLASDCWAGPGENTTTSIAGGERDQPADDAGPIAQLDLLESRAIALPRYWPSSSVTA